MITQKEPTPQQVKDFAEYMFKRFNLNAIDKRKAWEMKALAWGLDAAGIVNQKKFMKYYSVNLLKRVYFPFEIGNSGEMWLPNQVAIIIHECQHSIQHRTEGFIYIPNYLFSSCKRANYEADAYRANMEIHYWYTHKVISPAVLADKLRNYGCTPADMAVACRSLEVAAKMVKHGGVVTEATKVAITWWEQNESHVGQGALLPDRYYL